MKGALARAAVMLGLVAAPAYAQVGLPPAARVAGLSVAPGGEAALDVGAGSVMLVLAPAGEHVSGASLADNALWQATILPGQDALSLHAPMGEHDTRLTLLTEAGAYAFHLVSVEPQGAPYVVRLARDGAGAAPRPAGPARAQASYKLSGDKDVLPIAIHEADGKTLIEWAPSQAIPAVFALDRQGNEELVNGYMRDEVFVIDRVYDALVFRIDKALARAQRRTEARR